MDDPLFDPWGAGKVPPPTPAPAPTPKRWRAPDGPPPSVPTAQADWRVGRLPSTPSSVALTAARAPTPRARLVGTPGFLRTMAAPRLEDIALRLGLARHEARVDDGLDHAPPFLRLLFHPWRGPWTEELSPPHGALELIVESASDEQVVVRTWLDTEADAPTDELLVPTARLGAAWLEGIVYEFVERVLARA